MIAQHALKVKKKILIIVIFALSVTLIKNPTIAKIAINTAI
jgi:hypothetical protein